MGCLVCVLFSKIIVCKDDEIPAFCTMMKMGLIFLHLTYWLREQNYFVIIWSSCGFATSLARYTPFLFTLNIHLHQTNLWSFERSFLLTCLHPPMSNIFLNSRRIASLHFSLDIKSGSHQPLGSFVVHQDLTLC